MEMENKQISKQIERRKKIEKQNAHRDIEVGKKGHSLHSATAYSLETKMQR